jgi:hypothetical protein
MEKSVNTTQSYSRKSWTKLGFVGKQSRKQKEIGEMEDKI